MKKQWNEKNQMMQEIPETSEECILSLEQFLLNSLLNSDGKMDPAFLKKHFIICKKRIKELKKGDKKDGEKSKVS